MRLVLLVLALVASVGSCQRSSIDKAIVAKPGSDAGRRPPGAADGRPQAKRVEIEAVFDIDRVAGGKRFQGSWLILPDGKRVVTSYRPMPGYYRFIEKRVVATGRFFRNPPHVQQIGARHFQLESLKLARGEVPYAVPPSLLPAPAVVTAREALDKRAGRWVTVRGKLIRLQRKGTLWTRARLRLPDGTPIDSSAFRASWAPLVGKQVTVVGYLNVSRSPSEPHYLLGQTAICEGHPPRCGVSDWPPPRWKKRRK